MRIEILLCDDIVFYSRMRTFLASKEIYKETGQIFWNDFGKKWFVCINNKGKTIGVCAYVKTKKNIIFCSDYVLPEYRNRGIYDKLFEVRMKECPDLPIKAVATKQSLGTFLRHGFVSRKVKGKFTVVERGKNG